MTGQSPAASDVLTVAARSQRRWHQVALATLARSALNFAEDRGTQMAAAISYYGLFSLFPLTLLAAAIFGIVLRSDRVQARVLEQLFSQLPLSSADQGIVQQALANAASLGPTLTVVSLFAALWTAGALSAAIRSALNVIFRAPRRRSRLRDKLLDYALIPIIGLPFLSGVIVTTGWRIAKANAATFPFVQRQLLWLWEPAAFLIPFLLSFCAFLLLYWVIPNRRIQPHYAAIGAILAATLFEALKFGFALYLAHFGSFNVLYGPLSSVIVLMFWVYGTANIMLFGAEVAAELQHVLSGGPRRGRMGAASDGDWRRALWSFARGLVLAVDEPADGASAPTLPR